MAFQNYFPIWNKLTPEQQQRIAGVIEHRNVKKGTFIHDSSAECLGLVMVRSGQLRAYILSEDGRELDSIVAPESQSMIEDFLHRNLSKGV